MGAQVKDKCGGKLLRAGNGEGALEENALLETQDGIISGGVLNRTELGTIITEKGQIDTMAGATNRAYLVRSALYQRHHLILVDARKCRPFFFGVQTTTTAWFFL